jgi:hypothetical protein
MFKITGKNGFHLVFGNDISISVIWGPGTYSDNRDKHKFVDDVIMTSKTAEIMIWDMKNDRDILWWGSDEVIGWLSVDDVTKIMAVCQDSSSLSEISKKLEVLKFIKPNLEN